MRSLRNASLAVVGIALLAATFALVTTGTARSESPSKEVLVVNPASDPALVRDVDRVTREPFQESRGISIDQPFISESASVAVPEGKRLVIEYVSVRGFAPVGQRLLYSLLTTIDTTRRHFLPANPPFEFSSYAMATEAGQQVRLYANGGTNVQLAVERTDGTGTASAIFTISGYLEDAP